MLAVPFIPRVNFRAFVAVGFAFGLLASNALSQAPKTELEELRALQLLQEGKAVAVPGAPVNTPTSGETLIDIDGVKDAPTILPTLPAGRFVAQPAATVAQPVAPIAQSAAPVGQPVAPVVQPAAPVAQPATTIAQPATTIAQPAATLAQAIAPVAQSAGGQPATPVATPPVETAAAGIADVETPVAKAPAKPDGYGDGDAYAGAGDAHGGDHGKKSVNLINPDLPMFLLFLLLTLAAFFLLAKYVWKPLLAALDEREATIKASLDNAEKVEEELAQIETTRADTITAADQKAKDIIEDARKGGAELQRAMENDGKEQARILRENAEREIGFCDREGPGPTPQ